MPWVPVARLARTLKSLGGDVFNRREADDEQSRKEFRRPSPRAVVGFERAYGRFG